jgi:hypothetical protein
MGSLSGPGFRFKTFEPIQQLHVTVKAHSAMMLRYSGANPMITRYNARAVSLLGPYLKK